MLNNPRSGLGSVAEFQSSALPWVTSSVAPINGSPFRITFPKVTKFIIVTTTTGSMSFGFTRNGVLKGNKYVLIPSSSVSAELRVTEMWLQTEGSVAAGYNILAGLTNIDAHFMPQLSGTLADGTAGWSGVG